MKKLTEAEWQRYEFMHDFQHVVIPELERGRIARRNSRAFTIFSMQVYQNGWGDTSTWQDPNLSKVMK